MTRTAEPVSRPRHPRMLYGVAFVAILLVVLGFWLLLRYGARSEFLMVMFANRPALMPSAAIARNLDQDTDSLTYSSLSVLADRRYAGAQARARELLRSRDEYTWFNAALYLGKLGDPQAVPYLIKGLRHPAWRAHADAVADLQAITGQSIGNDFDAWRQWYVTQHPDEPFDFEMRPSGQHIRGGLRHAASGQFPLRQRRAPHSVAARLAARRTRGCTSRPTSSPAGASATCCR